ncbi:MAG: hypothetical protein JHC95_13695 [Solirubrobacteraceae bacterium]|nr:hypothetical protein [Solirubrobacteraceae bacterium]
MAFRAGLKAALLLAAVLTALLTTTTAVHAASLSAQWNQAVKKAQQNLQSQVSGTKPTTTTTAAAPATTTTQAATTTTTTTPAAPPPASTSTSTEAASPDALATAKPGDEITLNPGTTLTVGQVTQADGKTTLTDATLQVGDVAVGNGVDGTASGGKLELTDGAFTVAQTLTDQSFAISDTAPLVYDLAATGATKVSGELVSTGEESTPAAMRTFAASVDEQDVSSVIPPAPEGKNFRFAIALNLDGSATVRVFMGNLEVIYGRISLSGSYEFGVKLPIDWAGETIVIAGSIKGSNILQPIPLSGLKGSITGDLELIHGVHITGGEITWDQDGFHLAGGAQLDCSEGAVTANLGGTYKNDRNWSIELTGGAAGGCKVAKELTLPAADITGKLEVVDGAVTGEFEVGGVISTTLLPQGVDTWDARFRFIYGSEQASSENYIAFYASAGIGTAQGKVNFDGTLAIDADFAIPFSAGTEVAFDGNILRETPGGPVTYDVGGSVAVQLDRNVSLGGALRLNNDAMTLDGHITIKCPEGGDVTASVGGDIPLSGGSRNWSLQAGGAAGPDGCGLAKDFKLGPDSGAGGSLRSVDGKLDISLDAQARIETKLIPTQTFFEVGFHFNVTPGTFAVAVNGSTDGAGFEGAIQSNGSFLIAFELGGLKLGGVSLGAKGKIERVAPSQEVKYSIEGGLTGKAEIYKNLFIMGGSVGISSEGGLTFSGTIRQLCNAGYLDATAKGTIKSFSEFELNAEGLSSKCRIGNGAFFDGQTFFANISASHGKVLYNAGASFNQLPLIRANIALIGDTSTWLTSVTGSISNSCDGCYERQVTQLKFSARAHVAFQTVSQITKVVNQTFGWIPFVGWIVKPITQIVNNVTTTCIGATAYGTVEVNGLTVKKITIGVKDPAWGLLTLPVQGALTIRLNADLEQAFTSAGNVGSLGSLPAVQLPPLGTGGPVSGWFCPTY